MKKLVRIVGLAVFLGFVSVFMFTGVHQAAAQTIESTLESSGGVVMQIQYKLIGLLQQMVQLRSSTVGSVSSFSATPGMTANSTSTLQTAEPAWCYDFTVDLKFGARGTEV